MPANSTSLRRRVDVLSVAGGGGEAAAAYGSSAWRGSGRLRTCTMYRDVWGVERDWGAQWGSHVTVSLWRAEPASEIASELGPKLHPGEIL